MPENLTIYYLQMLDSADLNAKPCPDERLEVIERADDSGRLNRSLYVLVGSDWRWTDKLPWSDERWARYAGDENLRTFVAYLDGETAGYYELLKMAGGTVDINYFGLAPGFTGKGIGGYLLSHAIRTAFAGGAERVTVNTCTRDHPGALPNYLARGFKQYRMDVKG